MIRVRRDWESRDVPNVARGGLLFQSVGRPSGRPGGCRGPPRGRRVREPRGGDHKIARRGLLVKSAADRLEGLEGVEVCLGMVEGGSLEKVQVVVEEEWSRNLR